MRLRYLLLSAAFLAVAVPVAKTDEKPALPEGNWILSTPNPIGDATVCLLKTETKDGKLVVSVVAAPPKVEASISGVNATAKELSFTVKTVQSFNQNGKEQKFANEPQVRGRAGQEPQGDSRHHRDGCVSGSGQADRDGQGRDRNGTRARSRCRHDAESPADGVEGESGQVPDSTREGCGEEEGASGPRPTRLRRKPTRRCRSFIGRSFRSTGRVRPRSTQPTRSSPKLRRLRSARRKLRP